MGLFDKAKGWAKNEFMPTEEQKKAREDKRINDLNRKYRLLRAEDKVERLEKRMKKRNRRDDDFGGPDLFGW